MTTIDKIDIIAHHDGKIKWNAKADAVKLYTDLKTHANGEVPKNLIDLRRPNEPEEIKEYRYSIYAPKTEHPINKVITSLTKIQRSPDYKVDYSKSESPTFIKETLQYYLESDFPTYDSLDSWLFDEALSNVLIDANSVIVILPLKYDVEENELIEPVPYISNSDETIFFKENDYCIVKSDRTVTVFEDGKKKEYPIYILSTLNEVVEYYKSDDNKIIEVSRFTHNLNELQAFRVRGMFYKNVDGEVVWKSPINSMVTHLNEAAREYSDLQAEKVLHIYSEKWTINTNTCTKCKGTGRVKGTGFNVSHQDCKTCNGTGYETVSPFKSHQINVDLTKPNQQIPPIPPAGYIQKDTAITKIIEESVSKHLYQALESVNMQFLFEVPLNESGISKQWDRDETDNFAYRVASILKYVRENVAYYINELRYYFVIPNKEQREKQLPTVTVPQKYDLVNNALLIEEYQKAKSANMSSVILASMEMEISLKRFAHDSNVSTYTKLVYKLDPLYGISEDEKILRLQNKGINETDYVISSNVHKYVRRALEENEGFPDLTYGEQMKIMNKYAQETIKSNSFESSVLSLDGELSGNVLAQSVGGLTGMIEIVKAVASGVYDLDAAVSLVSQRFGISEEEARRQLGTPTIIQSDVQAEKVATLTQ